MTRLAALLAASSAMVLTAPALAQDHSMHNMPGMSMPTAQPQAAKPKPKVRKPAPRRPAPAARPVRREPPKPAQLPAAHQGHDMQGMDHSNMPGMSEDPSKTMGDDAMPGMDMQNEHAGHDMSAMPTMQPTGTALPAGSVPAPRPPMDHYADRQFPPAEMALARRKMMAEEGGQTLSQVMFNLAEYQARKGRDGYRWDGEAWFGGDINRLTLKTEGEGAFRDGVEAAEIQALYSRAIGPYFNLQAGVRYDFKPNPSRAYAVLGFEGLAPYWFEVEGAVFLSDKGDLLGRVEGYYDQRLTQRLVLQPRVELNFAAQDVPENRIGAGLSNAELGLRLRYEITRKLAPYVGVSYDAKSGQTARYARDDGEDPTTTSFVAGVRIWF
ncbi:copper resistance protein CopB [Sphingomonas sp. Root710]|uniref:copper resistance protein B n=1 Tax=Sphingomonas sp. Root710 TaxID=1736594 RepID=UPI0006FE26C5|nr:copper resistance protein B [Sphingomonas sp. Root710]KRB78997.1 copper resistance protein CopB [Sphingomonas sp. Root710]